jgi:SAM-dependent methyltransferase
MPSDGLFFEELRRSEDRHFWFRARNRAIAAALRRSRPPLPPDGRVLELGCGNGNVLGVLKAAFPEGTVVGLDLHEEGLAHARTRAEGLLVQADLSDPPFQRAFDLVCLFDVLEHLDDDARALRRTARLLRPGGRILLTVPAHPWLWSAFDEAGGHRRRYTGRGLRGLLENEGYRVTYFTPYMGLLLPLMAGARLGRRCLGRAPATPEERRRAAVKQLAVVPGVNALLEMVLALELPLLRRRWRLPAGTSFLAEACRSEAIG